MSFSLPDLFTSKQQLGHCREKLFNLFSVEPHASDPHRIGGNRKRSKIDEHGSKIARKSVFDFHPIWRQMAIENSVSNDF